MNQIMMDALYHLRAELHACPEISGFEHRTKAKLKEFLTQQTSLTLYDCGDGFYAAHREPGAVRGIALRADYDALALEGGGAAHLCGHDGHATALCGVAMLLDAAKLGTNVFLLFQPAEETGAGALGCCEIFKREKIDEIYGLHNLPGYPFGKVTTRAGTFACASLGLTLHFKGKPTHAAYPENGISPASAIGKLLCELESMTHNVNGKGLLCTVIGVRMGERAFGAAASEAEVWLTLRGERSVDVDHLQDTILSYSEKLADTYRLVVTHAVQDVFPSTENDPACALKVLRACGGEVLPEPMRWSEDFGHYLRHCKGAFFGIGAGNCPALHTENYNYPDDLLSPSIEAFWKLLTDKDNLIASCSTKSLSDESERLLFSKCLVYKPYAFLIAACAAASFAIGTRNGEQET